MKAIETTIRRRVGGREETLSTLTGHFRHEMLDYDGEKSSLDVQTAALTAVNFDAQAALAADFLAAIEDFSLGNTKQWEVYNETLDSSAPVSDKTAQRELAWDIQIADETAIKNNLHSQLPTPDLTLLSSFKRGSADQNVAAVSQFCTAFMLYALTQFGNTPIVKDLVLKGRNL